MAKKYRYIGSGQGVPGLPHEITDQEAKALGVEGILKAALEAGTYEEMKKTAKKAREE